MKATMNDFDFVIDTIENNYAGFPSKVTESNLRDFKSFTISLRDKYLNTEDHKRKEELLNAFLAFFNDKHISIRANEENPIVTGSTELKPSFRRIDGDTVLISIPSFLPENYEAINNLIQEQHEVLTNTPNLILDLRGYGGGSDECFNSLLPYVCPESIKVVGADVRATQ